MIGYGAPFNIVLLLLNLLDFFNSCLFSINPFLLYAFVFTHFKIIDVALYIYVYILVSLIYLNFLN